MTGDLWHSTDNSPALEPLAWDLSDDRNGPVLMAVKHESRPFWGVQYHPESIRTNDAGAMIIQNWWTEAFEWSLNKAVSKRERERSSKRAFLAVDLDYRYEDSESGTPRSSASSPIYDLDTSSSDCTIPTAGTTPGTTNSSPCIASPNPLRNVHWSSLDFSTSTIQATTVLKVLQETHKNPIMLESGTKNGDPVRPETGRFSIIGCVDDAPYIRYSTSRKMIESTLSGSKKSFPADMTDVWTNIDACMAVNQASGGPVHVPFWGGLVGFVSYEAGLETIDVQPPATERHRPDIWFVLLERSVVIDHVEKKLYLQTLHDDDQEWMQSTRKTLKMALERREDSALLIESSLAAESSIEWQLRTARVASPSEHEYCDKVRICQDHIRAGSSYELCLTDQSFVRFSSDAEPSPLDLYRRLRTLNPAPFGAYIHLRAERSASNGDIDDLTILSSSPERFLSWSRSGRCQFRPIKGTVKKGVGMTREMAETVLNSDKEQAENLMIVDLIRHDLHGVVGSENVTVEKLMQVEEYETVYQLVSVIEGQLTKGGNKTGVDVLAASLPPGSMTGAPKKRSCELLREIEGHNPRGLYSGVLGYLDVGGGGDFSVVIRTAFRWADEGAWRIGAGGAVTVLSSPEGEFAEMCVKKDSSLAAFI
ncbi:hypothetical protein MBLNU459_g0926t2 [Dothideomycetes sp. NU459]